MNNGPPKIDVIAPTGRVTPFITTLDKISAIKSKREPHNILDGIKYLWSFPITLFIICGAASPTKPITPKNETHKAVINDAINNEMHVKTSTRIPSDLASSVPPLKALYFQLNK